MMQGVSPTTKVLLPKPLVGFDWTGRHLTSLDNRQGAGPYCKGIPLGSTIRRHMNILGLLEDTKVAVASR